MTDVLLPDEAVKSVGNVDAALKKVEELLSAALPNCRREVLDQLTSLERASALLSLSQALNTLFCLYLRTHGQAPEEHSAKSELERVGLYHDKLEAAMQRSKGPLKPTTSLDVRAANRFIGRAIPDLPDDEKNQLRNLSRQGNKRRAETRPGTFTRKRRPSGLTIVEEAAAFLAQASKDIRASNAELEVKK